jgi:hypothetical protein
MRNENKQYLLLAGVDGANRENVEVVFNSTDLSELLKVKELIQSIHEWGYYEEMQHRKRTERIVDELAELGATWWGDDEEYLPEVGITHVLETRELTDNDIEEPRPATARQNKEVEQHAEVPARA